MSKRSRVVQIYAKTVEVHTVVKRGQVCVKEIKAQKGLESHWPEEWFRHPFTLRPGIVRVERSGYYGMRKGDLFIKCVGLRPLYGVQATGYYKLRRGDYVIQGEKVLWKWFRYSQRDIDGSRKE